MKLGEALSQRSDLQKRVAQLSERLRASAVVQEGDRPPEDPAELLAELDALVREIERLVATINLTNGRTALPSGQTITQALARRDALTLRHTVLRSAAEAATQASARYSRSEIRIVRQIDVGSVRKQIDELARDRRELDVAIQAHNWTTELIED